jgi:hypothetical protein
LAKQFSRCVILAYCRWETDSVCEASVNLRWDKGQVPILNFAMQGECAVLEKQKRQIAGAVANKIHKRAIRKLPESRGMLQLPIRR